MITLRLLNDTVLTSLIRGVAMGMVAHFIGVCVSANLSDCSICWVSAGGGGSAMVWLPISLLSGAEGSPSPQWW